MKITRIYKPKDVDLKYYFKATEGTPILHLFLCGCLSGEALTIVNEELQKDFPSKLCLDGLYLAIKYGYAVIKDKEVYLCGYPYFIK